MNTLLLLVLLAGPPAAPPIVFQNAFVRVLQPSFAPGEEREMHEHPARVVIALTAAHLRQTLKDASVSEPRLPKGAVRFSPPVHHAVRNAGDARAELVEVELRAHPGAKLAPVSHPEQDPAHLSLVLDNEQVRVLRLRVLPGEATRLLRLGDRVLVALEDARLRFSSPDGRGQERRLARGTAEWQAAASLFVLNLGAEPVELVLVEPK